MKKGWLWLYPGVWATLIFVLSSLPDISGPELYFSASDKLGHVLIYIPLGYFLARAVYWQPGPFKGQPAFWAVFIGILYGLSDEIHQYFVPGRLMEIADWGADAIGIFLGAGIFYLLLKPRPGLG